MSYIYLASPYTAKSKSTRQRRYNQVLKFLSEQTSKGEVLFSPIVHSHAMLKYLPSENFTWEHWAKIDHIFIDNSDGVLVLKIPGWKKSKGIAAEVEYAKGTGKEVVYVDWTA